MPDIPFSKAKLLYGALLDHTDQRTAGEIADCVHLSKTPDTKKKLEWVKEICARLESSFEDSVIQTIRENSGCHPSSKTMEEIKRIYEHSADLDTFALSYNQSIHGSAVSAGDDGSIYFSYPTCYCSCVKHAEGIVSKTWCYCSLGYTKKLFSYVLGCEVCVELLESIKTGGERCLMRVTRK
jgi:hypothetical protein